MKIIRPETVTDSIFQSSTVPEADEAEWLSGTTYHLDDLVMVTTTANGAATATHKIYSSVHSQAGNDPTVDDGTNWTEVSSTNRWKLFDVIVQEQTENAGGMEYVLQSPTVINSLALINVDTASVTVEVVDSVEGTVYDETFSLVSPSGIQDWYAYFFEPIVRDDRLAILDLPPYANADITVTFTDTGTAKCGALIIGQFADLGFSQHGANYSIIDYSVKSTDSQGRVTITDGPYANKLDVDVVLNTSAFGVTRSTLTDLRTTPVVWVAEEDNRDSIVYGYYREFDIILSNPTTSRCSLEIEGLV
jgi:hypothetical protein